MNLSAPSPGQVLTEPPLCFLGTRRHSDSVPQPFGLSSYWALNLPPGQRKSGEGSGGIALSAAHRAQALPSAAPAPGALPWETCRARALPAAGAPAGPAHTVGPPRSLHAPLRRARLNTETPIVPGREERDGGKASRENNFSTRMRVSCQHPRIAVCSGGHANLVPGIAGGSCARASFR